MAIKINPFKPRTKIVQILLALAFSLGAILLIAALHHIAQLPEEIFVKKTRVEQFAFENFTTFEDAAEALAAWDESLLNTPITWDLGLPTLAKNPTNFATLSLKDLGVQSWLPEVKKEMESFMTEASEIEKIKVYFFGKEFTYWFSTDEQKIKDAFTPFGAEQGNKNATFALANASLSATSNSVTIAPEQIGHGIDFPELNKTLVDIWADSQNAPPPGSSSSTVTTAKPTLVKTLPIRTSNPEILSKDLEPLLPTAIALAYKTVTLTDAYSNEWKIPMTDYISWIVPGTSPFDISEPDFITYVELTLAPEIEKDPSPVTITDDGDGTYSFEVSAWLVVQIQKTALREQIKTALASSLSQNISSAEEDPLSKPIQIPTTEIKPLVTVPDSLKALGVTELLAFGYSDFRGSPANRIHNIETGIAQFNGLLVDKGETFSFMDHMSPVDAANGFLPELVIKGDETIPEYGGGLCQISSTMFRAILYTGLPIVSRTSHSYAVSYYARSFGFGLDATVYDPAPDLKFLNDTPASILIQSYTEGNSAYFVFYGTNDSRRVEMDGPYSYGYNSIAEVTTEYTDKLAPGERKLDTPAHTGFTTDWYRTIYYADGTASPRETIHSVYEARPAKYLEGVAEEIPT